MAQKILHEKNNMHEKYYRNMKKVHENIEKIIKNINKLSYDYNKEDSVNEK